MTDPGDPPSAEKSSEEQDRELAAQAAEYQSRARKLWREVVELVDGTDRDVNAAAKLSAESAKWERLAMDTRDRLAQRKHLREALEKRASMSGKRGNN